MSGDLEVCEPLIDIFGIVDESELSRARQLAQTEGALALDIFRQHADHLSDLGCLEIIHIISQNGIMRLGQKEDLLNSDFHALQGLAYLLLAASVMEPRKYSTKLFVGIQETLGHLLELVIKRGKTLASDDKTCESPLHICIKLYVSAVCRLAQHFGTAEPNSPISIRMLRNCFRVFSLKVNLRAFHANILLVMEWLAKTSPIPFLDTLKKLVVVWSPQKGLKARNAYWLNSSDAGFLTTVLCSLLGRSSDRKDLSWLIELLSSIAIRCLSLGKSIARPPPSVASDFQSGLTKWADFALTASDQACGMTSTGLLACLAHQLELARVYDLESSSLADVVTRLSSNFQSNSVSDESDALESVSSLLKACQGFVFPEAFSRMLKAVLYEYKEDAKSCIALASVGFKVLGDMLWRLSHDQRGHSISGGQESMNFECTRTTREDVNIASGSCGPGMSLEKRQGFAILKLLRQTSYDDFENLRLISLVVRGCREAYKYERKIDVLDLLTDNGDVGDESAAARECIGSLWSCFGTEILINGQEELRLDFSNKCLDRAFVLESGYWAVEALLGSQGRLDTATFTKVFLPAISYASEQESASGDAVCKLTWGEVGKCLKSSLEVFFKFPTDLDSLETMLNNFDSVIGTDTEIGVKALTALVNSTSISDPPVEEYTVLKEKYLMKLAEWAINLSERKIQGGVALLGACVKVCDHSKIPQMLDLLMHRAFSSLLQNPTGSGNAETYLELASLTIRSGYDNAALSESLLKYIPIILSLSKNENAYISLLKELSRTLQTILEQLTSTHFSHSETLLNVIDAIVSTRQPIQAPLWKHRIKLHEALVRYIDVANSPTKQLGVGPTEEITKDKCIGYLLNTALLEAAWKSSSQTSATRRRAYRVLQKACRLVLRLNGGEKGSEAIALLLMAGCSLSESIILQRGFVTATGKILDLEVPLDLRIRRTLEKVLTTAKPACFNLERSTRRSQGGTSRNTKSSRFTQLQRKKNKSRS